MKGSKLVLRWLFLQPKEMNSASFSLRTEAKVANQVGELSIYIQNFSRLFELYDSL